MFPCSYNAPTVHKLSVCLPVTALTFTQVCSDRFYGLAETIYRSQGSRLGSESHRSNRMDFGTFGVEWHIIMCTECGTFDNAGLGGPVNQKIHWPPKKPTGPPKTCNDPNVLAAGIYDFTREVANCCTLGLYITKNKYELTLPSEFCRFPVKIMAAYEALKKKKKTLAPWASGK